uniref:Secreted protein n=1 Tax=Tanacetum cinerariifolium TaxID=118510 RepID=A0A699GPX6_TANCI|nr:hypothetical protein [Tanacetum cinerariifolium]
MKSPTLLLTFLHVFSQVIILLAEHWEEPGPDLAMGGVGNGPGHPSKKGNYFYGAVNRFYLMHRFCLLVPSCYVIFDLEPLSLSFDFVFTSEILKSLSFSIDRVFHLAFLCLGFPAQSVRSSNADTSDSPYLLVLNTETSQSRQHVNTSLIHIESRKSPTKSLFNVGSSKISIFIVNTYVSLGCSGKITRIMRRTLVNNL